MFFLKTLQVAVTHIPQPPLFIAQSFWGDSITLCFKYLSISCIYSSSNPHTFLCAEKVCVVIHLVIHTIFQHKELGSM